VQAVSSRAFIRSIINQRSMDSSARASPTICRRPTIVLSFLKGLSYITKHTHVFTLHNEIFLPRSAGCRVNEQ
jgi:hypothetical protein